MRMKPKKLNWLEILQQRGTLTSTERQEYQRLKAGDEGERHFDQMILQNAPKIKTCWDDVNLEYCGRVTQMDKVVLHGSTLELLDFKNYQGNYEYENGRLYCNQKILPYNFFDQIDRAQQVYERWAGDYRLPIQVKSTLVFVHPAGRFKWQSPPPLPVVQYPEIPWWLSELNEQYRYPAAYDLCQKALLHHQLASFPNSEICSDQRYARLKKGFHCAACGSFAVKFSRFSLKCRCGHEEAKETAYKRTICEYGVIMQHKSLRRKELLEFLGPMANEGYLKKTLYKHFKVESGKKKGVCYVNKGVPFEEWFAGTESELNKAAQRISWKQ